MEYFSQCVSHFFETASSSALLRKASNTELVALAVLNDLHDLNSKGDFLQAKVYSQLAFQSGAHSREGKLTVVFAHTSKHNVAAFVHLHIAHSIFAPFFEKNDDFLPRTAPRYSRAEVSHGRLDSKQAG